MESIINKKANNQLNTNQEIIDTEFETSAALLRDHSSTINKVKKYIDTKLKDKQIQETRIEVEKLLLDLPVLEPYFADYRTLLTFVDKTKLFYVEELFTLLRVKNSLPKDYNTLPFVNEVLIDLYFQVIKNLDGLSIKSYKRESLIETLANLELCKEQLAVNQYESLYELLLTAIKDSKSTYEEEFVQGRIIKGVYAREENLYYVFIAGKKEVLLPKKRKLLGDKIQNGVHYLYISEISRNKIRERIFVSRTHPVLLKFLINAYVPLVKQGDINILAVVRNNGESAKVVVSTENPTIDPVKACEEGLTSLNNEFPGEKIEFIQWSEDRVEYLRNLFTKVELLRIENENSDIVTIGVPSNTDASLVEKNSANLKLIKDLLRCEFIIEKEMSAEELESWNRLL